MKRKLRKLVERFFNFLEHRLYDDATYWDLEDEVYRLRAENEELSDENLDLHERLAEYVY